MDKKSILMIDDVKLNLATAKDVLQNEYILYEASSAQEGFDILNKHIPDLILMDLVMPEMGGYEMIEILKSTRRFMGIPVIILTAHTDSENEVKALELGAADFITKPFVPAVMKRRIETQIELSSYQHSLEKLVQEKVEEVEKLQDALSVGFAELVESRDGITGGHVKNTGLYFDVFIKALKGEARYRDEITDEYIRNAVRSAPLHDIGKVGIDDVTLSQLGRLGYARDQCIEKHCTLGGQTFHKLRKMFPESEFLKIAENMTLYHHERWDGSGYPYGVSGEAIPLCARILGAADVLDALISPRLYKEPMSIDEAMKFFAEEKGKSFEPCIADAVIALKDEIIIIDRDFKTFEGAKFDDELARWKKYHPELKDFGKAGK